MLELGADPQELSGVIFKFDAVSRKGAHFNRRCALIFFSYFKELQNPLDYKKIDILLISKDNDRNELMKLV